jgi:hypothetical protein
MAWWQPLKGLLSRPTPDWYVDRLAYVGSSAVNIGAHFNSFTLWNNSNPPAYFYVYGLFLGMAQGSDMVFGLPRGDQPSSTPNTPTPVIANQGSPPGLLYQESLANTPHLDNAPIQIWCAQGILAVLYGQLPLTVIPPNNGFQVIPNGQQAGMSCTFYYVWK